MGKRNQRAYRSLAEYRQAYNLTQREAAKQFGVSQSAWSKMEAGNRHPRPERAKLLMEHTGVPLEVLMGIAP
jgi:transcriptional regulator with XRE-family HTH domain